MVSSIVPYSLGRPVSAVRNRWLRPGSRTVATETETNAHAALLEPSTDDAVLEAAPEAGLPGNAAYTELDPRRVGIRVAHLDVGQRQSLCPLGGDVDRPAPFLAVALQIHLDVQRYIRSVDAALPMTGQLGGGTAGDERHDEGRSTCQHRGPRWRVSPQTPIHGPAAGDALARRRSAQAFSISAISGTRRWSPVRIAGPSSR